MNEQRPLYVRCLDNHPYVGYAGQPAPTEPLAGLVVGQVYKVAPREEHDGDLWRIIDETGEDYLYPRRYFEPLTINGAAPTETITAHVPAWLKGVLHAEAVATQRSMSAVLREWLEERLDLAIT